MRKPKLGISADKNKWRLILPLMNTHFYKVDYEIAENNKTTDSGTFYFAFSDMAGPDDFKSRLSQQLGKPVELIVIPLYDKITEVVYLVGSDGVGTRGG